MIEWMVPALSGVLGAALVVVVYVIGSTLRRDHYLLAQVVQALNANAAQAQQRMAPPPAPEAPPGPRAVEKPSKRDLTRE